MSGRLSLRLFPRADFEAIARGERLDGWADDYPADGDAFVAGGLHRGELTVDVLPWVHYQVIEEATGLVVGGAGFHRPPENGQVEIGYGIVDSRQGVGYATEAAALLLDLARQDPEVAAVIATTDTGNVASQRVLTKLGFDQTAPGKFRLSLHPGHVGEAGEVVQKR